MKFDMNVDDNINKALEMIAQGNTIKGAAKAFGVCPATMCKLFMRAGEKYDLAREIRATLRVDQMLEHLEDLMSGKIDVAVFRELKDTVKWQACHEIPKRYGDKKEYNVKLQNITDLLTELPDE